MTTTRAILATPANADWASSAFNDAGNTFEQLYALLPFLEGKEIEVGTQSAPITPGVQVIPHYLGRIPRGFILIDKVAQTGATSASDIYRRDGDAIDVNIVELYAEANLSRFRIWLY